MNNFEYISMLTSNVNKSKSGGVICDLPDSSLTEISFSSNGRLSARLMQKVAFVATSCAEGGAL